MGNNIKKHKVKKSEPNEWVTGEYPDKKYKWMKNMC